MHGFQPWSMFLGCGRRVYFRFVGAMLAQMPVCQQVLVALTAGASTTGFTDEGPGSRRVSDPAGTRPASLLVTIRHTVLVEPPAVRQLPGCFGFDSPRDSPWGLQHFIDAMAIWASQFFLDLQALGIGHRRPGQLC